MRCGVCSNVLENSRFVTREMMFGLKDEFSYFECANCGCIQIENIPNDFSRFYPDSYYSFSHLAIDSPLQHYFISRRAAHLRGERTIVGRLYSRLRPAPAVPDWLARTRVDCTDAILEIGCGLGHRLVDLSYCGFNNLSGIDPFLKRDVRYRNGITLLKQNVEMTQGTYDFVMLHHTLEHMPNQSEVFHHLHRLLRPGKLVLIRIPVAGCFAWQKYREHWVQLDPPRHLFLHTSQSLAFIAKQTGFAVEQVIYDSTGFQFWGSEQYKKGIPLIPADAIKLQPMDGLFCDAELREFETQAQELNKIGQGDQACFYLRRI